MPVSVVSLIIPTQSPVSVVSLILPTQSPVSAVSFILPTQSPVSAVSLSRPTQSPVSVAPRNRQTQLLHRVTRLSLHTAALSLFLIPTLSHTYLVYQPKYFMKPVLNVAICFENYVIMFGDISFKQCFFFRFNIFT